MFPFARHVSERGQRDTRMEFRSKSKKARTLKSSMRPFADRICSKLTTFRSPHPETRRGVQTDTLPRVFARSAASCRHSCNRCTATSLQKHPTFMGIFEGVPITVISSRPETTAGASKAELTITPQPALAPSPQPQPAPTPRALPSEPVAQRGQNWTPVWSAPLTVDRSWVGN
jgi:hypothetical protein